MSSRPKRTVYRYWTRERIIVAFQEWADEHGRPPKAHEWDKGTPSYPARVTAAAVFGSWNAAMEAAGFTPRRAQAPGRHKAWTKAEIVDALLDFLFAEGRWPTSTDCGVRRGTTRKRHPGLPDHRTVVNHFGSFTAAKRAAGWDGTDPHCKKQPPPTEPGCVGCGTELDNYTDGCWTCWDRRRNRKRQANRTPAEIRAQTAKRIARKRRAEHLQEAA